VQARGRWEGCSTRRRGRWDHRSLTWWGVECRWSYE